jgi:hypothetical protein
LQRPVPGFDRKEAAMTAIVVLFALLLALVTSGTAHAASLFDFAWSSSARSSTLVRVDRVEPDGSITPYDEVKTSGTRKGSGVLTLTLPSTSVDGYTFTFAGADGAGTGAARTGGEIPPGGFSFALPSDVPVDLPGVDGYSGGRITLQGDPARPSAVSIAYVEGSSPHCVVNCSSVEFQGLGVPRRATVAALEPQDAMLAALGLLGVVWLRGRRPRRRPDLV